MFKKSLVALTVLSVCGSFVAAQANTTEFNQPDQSYVGKDVSIFGSSITAKDITITTDKRLNGLEAYGNHTLKATGDICITGKRNGIFTPSDDSTGNKISITSGGEVTIKGAWAIHSEGAGKIDIDAKQITIGGGNGIASNGSNAVELKRKISASFGYNCAKNPASV